MIRLDVIPHYGGNTDVDIEENSEGCFVDADVAQEMYEALRLAKGIMVNEQFYTAAMIIDNALKKAEGG